MQKIDESKLPLDVQAMLLAGMTFDELCDYIATNICNEENDEQKGA